MSTRAESRPRARSIRSERFSQALRHPRRGRDRRAQAARHELLDGLDAGQAPLAQLGDARADELVVGARGAEAGLARRELALDLGREARELVQQLLVVAAAARHVVGELRRASARSRRSRAPGRARSAARAARASGTPRSRTAAAACGPPAPAGSAGPSRRSASSRPRGCGSRCRRRRCPRRPRRRPACCRRSARRRTTASGGSSGAGTSSACAATIVSPGIVREPAVGQQRRRGRRERLAVGNPGRDERVARELAVPLPLEAQLAERRREVRRAPPRAARPRTRGRARSRGRARRRAARAPRAAAT